MLMLTLGLICICNEVPTTIIEHFDAYAKDNMPILSKTILGIFFPPVIFGL